MNVTLSLGESFYEDFKDLCHNRKVTFSSMFERLGSMELSKNLDNDRKSMPLFQDDKELWIRWIQDQSDETLKEFLEKIDLIHIYSLAFSKVAKSSRSNYGFTSLAQAQEFALR